MPKILMELLATKETHKSTKGVGRSHTQKKSSFSHIEISCTLETVPIYNWSMFKSNSRGSFSTIDSKVSFLSCTYVCFESIYTVSYIICPLGGCGRVFTFSLLIESEIDVYILHVNDFLGCHQLLHVLFIYLLLFRKLVCICVDGTLEYISLYRKEILCWIRMIFFKK